MLTSRLASLAYLAYLGLPASHAADVASFEERAGLRNTRRGFAVDDGDHVTTLVEEEPVRAPVAGAAPLPSAGLPPPPPRPPSSSRPVRRQTLGVADGPQCQMLSGDYYPYMDMDTCAGLNECWDACSFDFFENQDHELWGLCIGFCSGYFWECSACPTFVCPPGWVCIDQNDKTLTDEALPRCFADELHVERAPPAHRRGLSHGAVLHWDSQTHTLPRAEVVDAIEAVLDGEEYFVMESDLDGSTTVFELTPDGMAISQTADLTQPFNTAGVFVKDQPTVHYAVICEAQSVDVPCSVVQMGQPAFVGCSDDAAGDALKDRTLSRCAKEEYEVQLMAHGAHHFLLAARAGGPAGDSTCPPNIALDSNGGRKFRAVMFPEDAAALPSHWLGTAPLAALLAAEERAEPLDDAAYDAVKNNCAHYAQRIFRDLGFPETEDLATFVAKNIVEAPGLEALLQTHTKRGGHRVLASLANRGKTLLESTIKRIVLNQLE